MSTGSTRYAFRISSATVDTTNSYLLELIEFLVTHADRLLNGYHRYQPIQDKEPRQWMETVLMRGLRDEMRTRAL